jgi:hypothetical protein
MKVNGKSASRRTRTPLARALAFVLLIGTICAVTFDSAHSHRNFSSTLNTNTSASAGVQANASSEVPLHSRSDGDECLICLLHKQFSSIVVQTPVFSVKPSAQVVFVSEPTFFYYSSPIVSRPIARLSGRAPPVNRG